MKLQYFNQPAADTDDEKLTLAKQLEHVPASCLLGGNLVMQAVAAGLKPCDGCKGPRVRCKGTPERKDDEAGQVELSRLRALLTGSEDDPISELTRVKP